jgi:hypothetical protein
MFDDKGEVPFGYEPGTRRASHSHETECEDDLLNDRLEACAKWRKGGRSKKLKRVAKVAEAWSMNETTGGQESQAHRPSRTP